MNKIKIKLEILMMAQKYIFFYTLGNLFVSSADKALNIQYGTLKRQKKMLNKCVKVTCIRNSP
jgi:hypothetical protein